MDGVHLEARLDRSDDFYPNASGMGEPTRLPGEAAGGGRLFFSFLPLCRFVLYTHCQIISHQTPISFLPSSTLLSSSYTFFFHTVLFTVPPKYEILDRCVTHLLESVSGAGVRLHCEIAMHGLPVGFTVCLKKQILTAVK